MQVVAPRADAVRFSAFWVRAPQDTPTPPPESLVLSLSGLPAVVVASRVAGVRTILMQVVAPRATAVRFSAFWVRAPQDTPPPPPPPRISLVESLSGLPAVVAASRDAALRTILTQAVAPRADAVRHTALWVRAPRIPPPPPGYPW